MKIIGCDFHPGRQQVAILDSDSGEMVERTLDRAVAELAGQNSRARLLMTQPGVGPNTALAFVLTVGDVNRFPHSRELSSYVGLVPRESSSGAKPKLGSITKQGNQFLRTLLVEAAQSAVRYDEGLRREYQHRCHHKAKGVAKVAAARKMAAARKLAVRLYSTPASKGRLPGTPAWMLRTGKPYSPGVRIEGCPGHSVAEGLRPSS